MVSDPIPAPGSPLPALSGPDMREDWQDIEAPVGVSTSVVLPAVAVIFPPGRTVQVFAAAADAAPGLAARIAAPVRIAALTRANGPVPARIGTSSADRRAPRYRSRQ